MVAVSVGYTRSLACNGKYTNRLAAASRRQGTGIHIVVLHIPIRKSVDKPGQVEEGIYTSRHLASTIRLDLIPDVSALSRIVTAVSRTYVFR